MVKSRVLLVGSDGHSASLPALIEGELDQRFKIETMAAVQEAMVHIAGKGYDAAVCWAEREDELEGVIRIRKASPELPILLLTSRRDPGFRSLATEKGATSIVHANRDLSIVSETVRLAIITRTLARDLKTQCNRARTTIQKIESLARENRELCQAASRQVRRSSQGQFVPLLVEDDLDHALLMVRAFARANVFTPLPILKTGEEAIDFLSEEAVRLKDRRSVDSPSLIILDIELPRKSGFEVLEWIRKQPDFQRLPVVMLTSSTKPEDVNRAYRMGANSYLLKPTTFDALVELGFSLKRYGGATNQSCEKPYAIY